MFGFLGRIWPLLAFIGISFWYTIWCPFNKVEESFNTQAIHDFIYHFPQLSKFDHFEFPGVVPRTFIGAIVVAAITRVFLLLTHIIGFTPSKLHALIASRLVLTSISGICWFKLQRAINFRFGSACASIFAILTLVQFHPLFYTSRALPNTFALNLVYLAYAFWFKGNHTKAIQWLTICSSIFRFEVAVLLFTVFLTEATTQRSKLLPMLKTMSRTWIASVVATITIDSLMWRKLLWPELSVFYFNIIQNKSSEWGTQPWLWYLYKALPNALLLAYPFAFLGLFRSHIEKRFFIPIVSFLALFSMLPHKELRFIFYIIPVLNLSASSTIQSLIIDSHKRRSLFSTFIQAMFVLALGLCFLSSIFRVHISGRNYPGGEAMIRFHKVHASEANIRLHIDVETAMSGCSRFLQMNEACTYEKTENLSEEELKQYNYLLSAHPVEGFEEEFAIKGFSGLFLDIPRTVSQLWNKLPYARIRESDKIFLLRRSDHLSIGFDQILANSPDLIGQDPELLIK